MPYIQVLGIICDKTQEAVDEPFMKFVIDEDHPALKVELPNWGPVKMDDGETKIIPSRTSSFYHTFRIELWERDLLRNDRIGGFTIHAPDDPGEYGKEQSQRISGERAVYRVFYVVSPRRDQEFVLDLVSLRCGDAQEATDEPYLLVNGAIVWESAAIKTNQIATITSDPIMFSGAGCAEIELWERDPLRSNKIGTTFTLDESHARDYAEQPERSHTHVFRGRSIEGDASYTLTYRVRLVTLPVGEDPDHH